MWDKIRDLKEQFPTKDVRFLFSGYEKDSTYVINVRLEPWMFDEVYKDLSEFTGMFRNVVANYYFLNCHFNLFQENIEGENLNFLNFKR